MSNDKTEATGYTPEPTKTPVSPKVVASTVAGGGVLAVATVVTWILGLAHIDVPSDVALAGATVLVGAAVWVAGFFKSDPHRH